MDDLLAEMRGVEESSLEDTWPTRFSTKVEKQVSIGKILNSILTFLNN